METNRGVSVTVDRLIPGSPEQVFDVFTDPGACARWFKPDPDMKTTHLELDLRVGGLFRVILSGPQGDMAVACTYLRIERPERLEFTWTWEEGPYAGEPPSTVTVSFEDAGESTRVTVTHALLASREVAASHERGWSASLALLREIYL
jgi:uncharacterized protein YndB with AHSA1/START domain